MKQALCGGYNGDATGANCFAPVHGGVSWTSVEINSSGIVTTAGTISKLRVHLSNAPADAATRTFTLYVNSNPTALTVTFGAADTTKQDLAHSVNVAVGDVVVLKHTLTAAPTACSTIRWGMLFTGTTAKQSLILGSLGFIPQGTTRYSPAQFAGGANSLEPGQKVYAPTSFTFKNMYIKMGAAPGGAETASFTLRKNGAPTGITLTITGAATTGNVTADVAAVQGDAFDIQSIASAGCTNNFFAAFGLAIEATIDGESVVMSHYSSGPATGATNWVKNFTATGFWDATETNSYQLTLDQTMKKLYVILDGSPGAGNSYTFTLRDAGNTLLSVIIQNAETSKADNVNSVDVHNDDDLTFQCVPAGPPTARNAWWSMVEYQASGGLPESRFGSPASKLIAAGIL